MKTKKQKNKTFSYLVILLLVFAIPVGIYLVGQKQEIRQRAAPATVLTFSPASITKKPGETFTADVIVDTGSNTISAAKIQVDFDNTKLQATALTASNYLPIVLSPKKITDTNASITLGSSPTEPKRGIGTLMTITFKAKGPTGDTQITFDNSTEIAGINEQTNILSGKGSMQVTISNLSVPTPTRSQARANPTPSPLPSQAQPGQRNGFGGLNQGSSQQSGQSPTYSTSDLPLPLITPVPQPGEEIKDPVIIAYVKAILQFIGSLFGK